MILRVETNPSYDVVIERGALLNAGSLFNLDRKVLVLTDDGVPFCYAESVANASKEGHIFVIPHGEQSKCMDSLQGILSFMLDHEFSRKDAVVAVGGGVCGDLGGFAASIYMRGVEFYNVPTTLLSMVDSSIGGKTAIDFDGYKNVVGAFYQPSKVLIDPNVLSTLDERQLHAGLVEAIKMAATFDKDLFETIEKSENIQDDIEIIIGGALAIKKDVVEKDTKESGLRKVLNFGHTIGHAIEADAMGKLLHGECVGIGMMYVTKGEVKERIEKLLKKYNVPTTYEAPSDVLMKYVAHDKKASHGNVDLVISNEIGTFEIKKVPVETIEKILEGERL